MIFVRRKSIDEKEAFFADRESCRLPLTHITDGAADPALDETDALFGAADVLSVKNAEKHRRILLALSAAGTLLTLAFLLYDEAEWHGLILACGVMILCLVLIRRLSARLDCHRRYLQYRVLAECLRVQYFLSLAGTGTRAADMLPWSVRRGIPWVEEILTELPLPEPEEKRPVLDCWIRDQKRYHEKALKRTESREKKDGRAAKAVLAVTLAAYVAALVFELVLLRRDPGAANADTVRAVLKIVLGTMSAVTLFTGSYYGKMSLSNVIDDHKRMISLYETAEERILRDGESEELLLFLARECLNENSTWYAYQSKNKPDLVI